LVLGELPYPEAATAIAARMFDPDDSVRRAAMIAARALKGAPEVSTVLTTTLERILRSSSEHDARRVISAIALSELTCVAAIPTLIAVLSREPKPVREAARRALRRLTCQDFAEDVEFWDAWWSERGGEERAEWLFDALTHDSPELRAQASSELAPVLPFEVPTFSSLDEAGRLQLQARCRAWWRGKATEPAGSGEHDDPRRL
jgi:HEAT repeat protein